MELILITNDPKLAKYAEDSGVDRIMVDLEIIGKKERQGHLNTVISEHSIEDVFEVRGVLNKSKLLVRVNPIHINSEQEIENVLSAGADFVMLPMFTTSKEVKKFISIIGGRAKTMLLLETPQAMVRIDEILELNGIDGIFVGLNDLHLALRLDFMFELLSGGIIEYLSNKIKKKGIQFGFGGIARIGYGVLDSSLILSEHYRLKSECVILSRNFHSNSNNFDELRQTLDLKKEVIKVRNYLNQLKNRPISEPFQNRNLLVEKVRLIADNTRTGSDK